MRNKLIDELNKNEKQPATIWKRFVAFLIDELLVSIIVIFILYDKLAYDASTQEIIKTINEALFFVLIIKFLYHAFFYYQHGATLGKIFMKIRVIDMSSYDNPSFWGAINRSGMRLMSEFFFYFGFVLAFFDKELHQALHDKLSRTIVIDV